MKHSTGYLPLIQSIPPHRTALVENGRFYTYSMFTREACHIRSLTPEPSVPSTAWIRAASVHGQLVRFLALSDTSHIPVIMPADVKYVPESLITERPPAGACMGVLTSGSTGQPRLWFRTLDGWASFFLTQNAIFGMTAQTRFFAHGSLAFTDNLNLYLSLLSLGASIIIAFHVNPFVWCRETKFHHTDALHLIPSKLRLLAKYIPHPSPDIKTILAGSQSLGHRGIILLKAAYPNGCCFLYHGTSELNYVTWLTSQEMDDNPACIGKPFPGVDVTLRSGEIYVDIPYSAIGTTGPCSVGDMDYTDHKGYLYLNDRKGNVYNIHGRKVSAVKIENVLNSPTQIQKTTVILQNSALQAHVVPTVSNPSGQDAVSLRRIIKRGLNDYLESWEIPGDIIFHENLPKSDSGKTIKRLLSAKEWIAI